MNLRALWPWKAPTFQEQVTEQYNNVASALHDAKLEALRQHHNVLHLEAKKTALEAILKKREVDLASLEDDRWSTN